jgi:hypothetical protein
VQDHTQQSGISMITHSKVGPRFDFSQGG